MLWAVKWPFAIRPARVGLGGALQMVDAAAENETNLGAVLRFIHKLCTFAGSPGPAMGGNPL